MFRHLHIVGCSPRSGTTLLHEVMVTCFAFDRHYEHERRFHRVDVAPDATLISKWPKDTLNMPSVIDDVPNLHVIYLLRDPRDTICSRHGKDRSVFYSNIRLWRDMQASARKLAGHERFLEVRYEDFVTDPDPVQRLIADRFPWLTKLHDFSRFHEHAESSHRSSRAMNGVRPIAPTSVGVWRETPGRVKAQQILHGSLTPDLIACGYETSDDWEAALEGVEPDYTPSVYPERQRVWGRWRQRLDSARKAATYRKLCRGL